MKLFFQSVLFLFALILFAGHAVPAAAQQAANTPQRDLKEFTQEEFVEATKLIELKPFNSTKLEFEIRLPKDWEQKEMAYNRQEVITKLILNDIAKFYGPAKGDVRPFAHVRIIEIEHEILAEHWLKNYMFTNGYVPMDKISAVSDQEAYGTYVTQEGPATFVMTTTVRIHRNWAIVAQFALPVKDYYIFGNLPLLCVKSFRMHNPPEGTTEEWRIFSLLSALKFSYPSSWIVSSPDFTDPNRPSVELHNKPSAPAKPKGLASAMQDERLDGLIKFIAIRKTEGVTLKRELIRLRKRIEGEQDLQINSLISTHPAGNEVRFTFGVQEVYDITFWKQIINQELWFSVFEDEEYYIFVYMLTPKEDEIYYQWARNILAYRDIIKSFK